MKIQSLINWEVQVFPIFKLTSVDIVSLTDLQKTNQVKNSLKKISFQLETNHLVDNQVNLRLNIINSNCFSIKIPKNFIQPYFNLKLKVPNNHVLLPNISTKSSTMDHCVLTELEPNKSYLYNVCLNDLYDEITQPGIYNVSIKFKAISIKEFVLIESILVESAFLVKDKNDPNETDTNKTIHFRIFIESIVRKLNFYLTLIDWKLHLEHLK